MSASTSNPREKLARILTGYWEYECRIDTTSETFDGGEVGRGGRMTITSRSHDVGVRASIQAVRLWTVRRSQDGIESKQPLRPSVQWQAARGGIWITDEDLVFAYSSHDKDGEGETTDTYSLDKDKLILQPGRFVHRRSDGKKVTGSVRLRRMESPIAFELAPLGCDVPLITEVVDRAPDMNSLSHKDAASYQPASGHVVFHGDVAQATFATGAGSTVESHFHEASVHVKALSDNHLKALVGRVLDDARHGDGLDAKQRAFVAEAVKDLLVEVKSPKKSKARALAWVGAIQGLLPTATSAIELAEKVKALFD